MLSAIQDSNTLWIIIYLGCTIISLFVVLAASVCTEFPYKITYEVGTFKELCEQKSTKQVSLTFRVRSVQIDDEDYHSVVVTTETTPKTDYGAEDICRLKELIPRVRHSALMLCALCQSIFATTWVRRIGWSFVTSTNAALITTSEEKFWPVCTLFCFIVVILFFFLHQTS